MNGKETVDPVLDRILGVARADGRFRAVILSGSRADPTVPADRWRDYDLVFVVRDVAPFRGDSSWVDVFGEHDPAAARPNDRRSTAAGGARRR